MGGQAGFVFLTLNSPLLEFLVETLPSHTKYSKHINLLNCCLMFFFFLLLPHFYVILSLKKQFSKLVELWSLFFTKYRYIIYRHISELTGLDCEESVFVMWLRACLYTRGPWLCTVLCFLPSTVFFHSVKKTKKNLNHYPTLVQ